MEQTCPPKGPNINLSKPGGELVQGLIQLKLRTEFEPYVACIKYVHSYFFFIRIVDLTFFNYFLASGCQCHFQITRSFFYQTLSHPQIEENFSSVRGCYNFRFHFHVDSSRSIRRFRFSEMEVRRVPELQKRRHPPILHQPPLSNSQR